MNAPFPLNRLGNATHQARPGLGHERRHTALRPGQVITGEQSLAADLVEALFIVTRHKFGVKAKIMPRFAEIGAMGQLDRAARFAMKAARHRQEKGIMQQLAPIVLGQEIAQFRQIDDLCHAQLDGGLGEKAFRERQPTFVERQPDGPYCARFPC